MKIKTRLKRQKRLCYRKDEEIGLWYEIKCQEDLIKSPTASREDKKFARQLLESYKTFTEAYYSGRFCS